MLFIHMKAAVYIYRTYAKKPGFYGKSLFLTINIYEKPGFWVRLRKS